MPKGPAFFQAINHSPRLSGVVPKLFAKWLDTVHMCLDREANHRQRIEELAQNVQDLKQEIQELKQQLAKDRLF
jgi:predicted  nucleic acid-binding Zn-ribbon protein